MTEYEELAKLIYKKRSYLSRTKNKETAKRLEAEIAELMAKKNALPKPEHGKIQSHIRNYQKPTPAPPFRIYINEMPDVMRFVPTAYLFIKSNGSFNGSESWKYDRGGQLDGDGYRTTKIASRRTCD